MENKDIQTEFTNNTICNHEEELDILCQRLLKYNKEMVGSFIESITNDYEQRIKDNNIKLRDEIERIRLRLQEAQKCLMKSHSTC